MVHQLCSYVRLKVINRDMGYLRRIERFKHVGEEHLARDELVAGVHLAGHAPLHRHGGALLVHVAQQLQQVETLLEVGEEREVLVGDEPADNSQGQRRVR